MDWTLRKIALTTLAVTLAGCAHENTIQVDALDIDSQIRTLESECSNYKNFYPYEKLIELRDKPNISGMTYDFRLYIVYEVTDWVPLSRTKSCQLAVLKNMDEGLTYSLKVFPMTSYMHSTLYLKLAYTKLAKVVLVASQNAEKDYSDADDIMMEYIENDDYKPELAMAHYFAAATLVDISRLSNNPDIKRAMLSRSLEIAENGLKKAKDKSKVSLVFESATNELARYGLGVCKSDNKCIGSR